MMAGPPPFGAGRLATLENWQRPPFNRWSFQHVRELIPTARIPRGDGPAWELPRAEREDLGDLRFDVPPGELAPDGALTVRELLMRTYTDGFLVIHRGRIVAERYFNGLRPDVPHLLMSVSKSITGLAAGALAGEGKLDVAAAGRGRRPRAERHRPSRARPSSTCSTCGPGTRFREDYDDPDAEVAVSDRVYVLAARRRQAAPRRRPRVLRDARPTTGRTAARSATARSSPTSSAGRWRRPPGSASATWSPASCGSPWAPNTMPTSPLTPTATPLADGGISATLRDAGRIGLLALRRGRADGRQVIAPQWFDDTVRGAPDGPGAFLAGDGAGRGYPTGAHYRNCWWVIDPGLPLYCAAGVFGQSVFVHGRAELVVAKLSSWPVASSPPLRTAMVAAVRAIASALRRG